MVSSFRAQAMSATFVGFPAALTITSLELVVHDGGPRRPHAEQAVHAPDGRQRPPEGEAEHRPVRVSEIES